MKQAATRKLYSYWDSLRDGRSAPDRSDIDPAAIRTLLQDTFILEVDRDRTLPVRIAGARAASLFLRELKGESFRELFREEDRDCLDALVASVLEDPTPAVAGLGASPTGREKLDVELLLLPLRHQGATHSRLLASLAPAASPAWLGLLEIEPLSLRTLRVIRRESLTHLALDPERAASVAVLTLPGGVEAIGPRARQVGATAWKSHMVRRH